MSELEEAQKTILVAEGKLSEVLGLMEHCPFTESFDRIASVLELIDVFTEGQAKLLAAVAIHRLERLVRDIQKIAGPGVV